MTKKLAILFLVSLIFLLIIGTFLFKSSSEGSVETYVGSNLTTTPTPTYQSPISIDYLKSLEFTQSEITFEETLSNGSNYKRYIAYVDNLAKNNFVVFKIDLRGHGNSEGNPSGSYFSAGYTIDVINAVKALQTLPEVNDNRICMWGHSMAGNLTLRAMEVMS